MKKQFSRKQAIAREHRAIPKPAPRFLQAGWAEAHFQFIFNLILAASAALYAVLNAQYMTGFYNDDAVYVLGARELAGKSVIHSLILKPDYPLPGLPLLLAPLARFVGSNWTSLEWVSVGVTVLLTFLVGTWTRRWLSAGETLMVTALFAFNPVVCKLSGILMPSPYYAVAVMASFIIIGGLLEKPTIRGAVILGVIVGWGSLIRPEGVLLLVSIAGALIWTSRGRGILRVSAIPIALWTILLWYWFHRGSYLRTEYGGDVAALISYWAHHMGSGVLYLENLLRVFLLQALTGLTLPKKNHVLLFTGIVLCLGALAMGFRTVWRQRRGHFDELFGVGLFCGLYGLVHLFWHIASSRYAIPLLPFLFVFFVRGLHDVLAPFKRRKIGMGLVLALLLVCYSSKDGRAVYESIWAPNPLNTPSWNSLSWLKRSTPADANVLSIIAPSVELYADRPALTAIKASNMEMFLYLLEQLQLSYIVDRSVRSITPGVEGTEDINFIWGKTRLWVAHYPRRFHAVYVDPVEQTVIYQVDQEPAFNAAYEKYRMAAEDYLNGHDDQAFNMLQDALALYPGLASASNLQGGLYMRRNDFKKAERAFLKSIERMPDSPSAMVNLASLYRLEGKTQSSNLSIQRALDVAKVNGDEEALKERLQALYRLWDRHQAIIFMDTF